VSLFCDICNTHHHLRNPCPKFAKEKQMSNARKTRYDPLDGSQHDRTEYVLDTAAKLREQFSAFPSPENDKAIDRLEEAVFWGIKHIRGGY